VRRDPVRDAQYTRELGEAVVGEYLRNTVAMATHLVSSCAFTRLTDAMRARLGHGADLFAMLRSQEEVSIPRSELAADVERLKMRVEERGDIVLGPGLARASGREILDEALRAFTGYYTTHVLEPRGDVIAIVDTKLIFYYQNRLAAHGLSVETRKPERFELVSRAPSPPTAHGP
jgi:glycerol-3-phosphate O-acyltransferase